METEQKDLRAELASVLARFDVLLQRLRGQLADSTSDFAYPIIRGYANELGDIRNALTSHGGGGEAVDVRLFDGQWVNIVNHADCYRDMDKDEAIALAVKLTEKAMAENIVKGWPKPRTSTPQPVEARAVGRGGDA